jgi:hypothetical protein
MNQLVLLEVDLPQSKSKTQLKTDKHTESFYLLLQISKSISVELFSSKRLPTNKQKKVKILLIYCAKEVSMQELN